MVKESKKTVEQINNVPEQILLDTAFISVTPQSKAVAKEKIKSELVIAKETLTKGVEQQVRSVSSYFAQYRKQYKDISIWIKEAQAKRRRFNATLVHDIINNGNLKPILEADDILQAAKAKPAKIWSAARLHAAFTKAVEIKAVKS